MNELYKTRAKMMMEMDEYVLMNILDEELIDMWYSVYPDDVCEDDLLEIASFENCWLDIINQFGKVCKWAGIID